MSLAHRYGLCAGGVLSLLSMVFAFVPQPAAAAGTPELFPAGMKVERVVVIYRHGLRAPLDDETGDAAYVHDRWPVWATANADLTPHGREGVRLMGGYDRALFASLGLIGTESCPTASAVEIYTDSDSRSMASGDELREGLAPGCQIATRHLAPGTPDLTFSAGAPGAAPFDGAAAVASVRSHLKGSQAALIAAHGPEIATLEKVLGCRAPGARTGCDLAAVPETLSADADGLKVEGPVMAMSSVAEVFVLQYAEGMPMSDVGWGRATPEDLAALSVLHGQLFDIFDRPVYMAHRTAALLAPRVRARLTADQAPKVQFYVGHDNNIAAMAALLKAKFQLPSYGAEDMPLGGGLGFALLQDPRTGERFVRVFYQAQTLDQLRQLTHLTLATPPAQQILAPACARGVQKLCRLKDLAALLTWPGQAAVPAAP